MLCPYCPVDAACHVCGGSMFLPAGFVKVDDAVTDPALTDNGEDSVTGKKKKKSTPKE